MCLDVSVYSTRVRTGYLTTVAGGTARSIGTTPYSAATSSGGGGSVSGVVRTSGDQIASGLKIWDASSFFNYDISIGKDLIVWKDGTFKRDVSISGDLYLDGSVFGFVYTNIQAQTLNTSGDVSIGGNLYANIPFADVSITNLTVSGDISVGGTIYGDIILTDASIINLSVSNDVSAGGTIYSHNLEVATLDVSIKNVSTTYLVTSTDRGKLLDASGTFTITFPNNLNMGFQSTILNSGPGIITLNASTLLSTDSSVRLINRYAGASAIHKGNGIWYAFGNLK